MNSKCNSKAGTPLLNGERTLLMSIYKKAAKEVELHLLRNTVSKFSKLQRETILKAPGLGPREAIRSPFT